MRTSFSASGPRSPKWHEASDAGASWGTNPRRDAEFTLGLDDEWEDVPTAALDVAAYDEATTGVDAAAPPAPVAAPAAAVQTAKPRGEPILRLKSAAESKSFSEPIRSLSAEQVLAEREASDSRSLQNLSPQIAAARAPLPPAAPQVEPRAPADVSQPVIATAPKDITTGSLLCNRYLLGRVLGTGGSSLIFQAEDRRRIGAQDFGSRIAIKVLRPEMRHNAHALTRLKREFRQMQRLAHPGVARVFELGHDEDIWFMTMELIEGQTINQWLKAATTRTDGMQVISSCCEALAHAHEAGVVHGDLKPSNVLVLPSGGVKLVDFGSAAERDATTGEVDKERSFAATPPYASPQVLAGDVADPRDDVFSLACLTYAVLTNGEHPFARKSSAEAQQAQLRPRYARTIHPRQFEVLVRALAWDREQRPASVREFNHALLASDWRREPSSRDSIAAEAASRPLSAPSAPSVAPTLTHASSQARTQTSIHAPSISATSESIAPAPEPAVAAEPKTAVRPDDVARLKAAVAAAEAHAERIEKPAAPAKVKAKVDSDGFDRFRGYVAGPLAPQGDEAGATTATELAVEPTAPEKMPEKKNKRIWPWQRSALIALAVVGSAALLATQVIHDAETLKLAAASPATSAREAAPSTLAPTQVATVAATSAAPVAEKKSPPVAVKPATPAAAPGEVSFSTRTLQVGAGQTMAALAVTRVNSTRGRARVAWTIEGGTARRGLHYELANSQIIEFLDGQKVRSLFIPLTPDKDAANARHSKTFTVKLQQATGGPPLGEIKQVYVTIVGDVADEKIAGAMPTGSAN